MKNRTKYKHLFQKITINNRWNKPYYQRNDDWIIFGISKKFFHTTKYEYMISLFGIDIRIWFERLKRG